MIEGRVLNVEEIKNENTETEKIVEPVSDIDKRKHKEERLNGFLTFAVGFLAGIITIGIAGLSVYLIVTGNYKKKLESGSYLQSEVLTDSTVAKVTMLENLIKYMYYEDVDIESLENGLYKGILLGVGDPYSCYYDSEELKKMNADLSGNYKGIGVYLLYNSDSGYVSIEGFLDNSSAEEAGMEIGDVIVAINGEDIYGKSVTEIASMVKGEAETTVDVTIVRGTETLDYTLERKEVATPSVSLYDEGEGIFTIGISEFAQNTSDQFEEAMTEAKENGMKALIIDLRGNPGGSVDAVSKICNSILPEGDIVYTEDKNGKQTHYESSGKTPIDVPLAVLVDRSSASSSEIMAGAIKDYGVGEIIGTTTYGKGVVQSVIPLQDGSAVKITTSRYYTPSGVNINHEGIEPDENVPFDAQMYLNYNIDNQFEAALKYVKGELGIPYEEPELIPYGSVDEEDAQVEETGEDLDEEASEEKE